MNLLVSVLVGGLFAAGLHLLMGRAWLRVVLGLAVLGQATFVLVLASGRLPRAGAPLVPAGADAPPEPVMDPVPQALVLTAIVIGFAVQAFALALFRRTRVATRARTLDDLRRTEAL